MLQRLLANCLEMRGRSELVVTFHQYRPALTASVVVYNSSKIECHPWLMLKRSPPTSNAPAKMDHRAASAVSLANRSGIAQAVFV